MLYGCCPKPSPSSSKRPPRAYKELRIWDVNGGAGRERGEASIKFFEESGLLKKDAVSFKQAFDTGAAGQSPQKDRPQIKQ